MEKFEHPDPELDKAIKYLMENPNGDVDPQTARRLQYLEIADIILSQEGFSPDELARFLNRKYREVFSPGIRHLDRRLRMLLHCDYQPALALASTVATGFQGPSIEEVEEIFEGASMSQRDIVASMEYPVLQIIPWLPCEQYVQALDVEVEYGLEWALQMEDRRDLGYEGKRNVLNWKIAIIEGTYHPIRGDIRIFNFLGEGVCLPSFKSLMLLETQQLKSRYYVASNTPNLETVIKAGSEYGVGTADFGTRKVALQRLEMSDRNERVVFRPMVIF